jgi:hypothetical protein
MHHPSLIRLAVKADVRSCVFATRYFLKDLCAWDQFSTEWCVSVCDVLSSEEKRGLCDDVSQCLKSAGAALYQPVCDDDIQGDEATVECGRVKAAISSSTASRVA